MNTTRFLKEFIAAPGQVGAVAPTSRALAEVVTDMACVPGASSVVEFGPGDGAITRVVLEKLPSNCAFFGMEINKEFCKTLKRLYPEVKVFNDSAVNTRMYMDQLGIEHCDAIVSGLPWSTFDDNLQGNLLDAILDVLRPGGRFVTYMYIMSPLLPRGRRFCQQIEARFSNVSRTPLTWMNVPPAYVYYAEK